MTKPLPLVCALLLAAAGSAAAFDLGQQQVLIDATLVSISKHEQMADAIDFFAPGAPIDLFTRITVINAAGIAASQTQSVITAIQADATLAASPVGSTALDHLELAQLEQLRLSDLLDHEERPVAQEVLAPVLAGLNFQVAAVNSLQGRPDRFSEGTRASREAGDFWSAYVAQRPWLAAHGLPTGENVLFEPFSGGKAKSLIEQIGLFPPPDVRLSIRGGQLELSAVPKLGVTSGVDFDFSLSQNYTVLITLTLPGPRNDKHQPREELEGFSAGMKVTTDASDDPAEAVFIEHQTSPDGWVQSLTGTKTGIVGTFPHATASQTRELTSFITKVGGTVVVGSVLKDGASQQLIQSIVPVVGDLPVLGLFFRNGTKKTKIDADNLLIFVTPHFVTVQ